MIGSLSYLSILLIYFLSLYGVGKFLLNWSNSPLSNYFSVNISVGMAAVIILGGLLNFFGIATPLVISLLIVSGSLVSIIYIFKYNTINARSMLKHATNNISNALPYLLIIISSIFIIIALSPPHGSFNFGDDLSTYISRPIRMLESGSLTGELTGLMPLDSLGGQAFMQAFIGSLFPIDYLIGFDAIFCYVLGGMLLIDYAKENNIGLLFTVLTLALYILINPIQVNISPVYSTITLSLTLIFILGKKLDFNVSNKWKQEIAIIALISMALTTLKVTSALFMLTLITLWIAVCLFNSTDKRTGLKQMSVFILIGLSLIAPWILIYIDKILLIFDSSIVSSSNTTFTLESYHDNLLCLTNEKMYYYLPTMSYYLLIAFILIATLFGIYQYLKNYNYDGAILFINGIASLLSFAIYIDVFYCTDVIRYWAPIGILSSTTALILVLRICSDEKKPVNIFNVFIGILSVYSIILFLPSTADRLYVFVNTNSYLPYYANKTNLTNVNLQEILTSDKLRNSVRLWQNKIDNNSSILALVDNPYFLDYKRNSIHLLSQPAVMAPWNRIDYRDVSAVRSLLVSRGIKYVLYQIGGANHILDSYHKQQMNKLIRKQKHISPLVRTLAKRNISLHKSLLKIANLNGYIYKDNSVIIFKI